MGALPQLYAATMPDVMADDYWGPDGFRQQRGHPTRVGRTKHAQSTADARAPVAAQRRAHRRHLSVAVGLGTSCTMGMVRPWVAASSR